MSGFFGPVETTSSAVPPVDSPLRAGYTTILSSAHGSGQLQALGTPLRDVRRRESVTIAKVRSSRREAVAKLKLEDIDYKRLDILTHFVTTTGKIEAARRTGANRKQQARVVRAIKRARYLALLPYVIDDKR